MLCDQFMRGAREAGHDVEKISLRELRIGYCTGCGACYDGHKPCPQHDDAAEVIGRMIAADTVVLATPVYFYTVSAQLKTLIDRCCARYTEIADKEFYFIATMAETEPKLMERTFDCLRGFLDCLDGAVERGRIAAAGVWHKGEAAGTKYMAEALEAGRTL